MMEDPKHYDADGGSQTNSNASPSSALSYIAKVKYHHQLIKIYSDSSEKIQFFFEPLVLLDPKSILSKSHSRGSVNFIQLTIQMWNESLRFKVLERLRSLETFQNVKIEEEDICVIPFDEVQLICKSGGLPV